MSNVIIWDLDHTQLNTERKLFAPVLQRVADFLKKDVAEVEDAFKEANTRTFQWKTWMTALGMDDATASRMEEECAADVAARAESCMYHGIVETLARYKDKARQVLVTAGDPHYQAEKFGWLASVHEFFAPEDRHFVPLQGSKADAVAKYTGNIVFIDDSPKWHLEVIERGMNATHIRPRWLDTNGTEPHELDNVKWTTVETIDELRVAIDSALKHQP